MKFLQMQYYCTQMVEKGQHVIICVIRSNLYRHFYILHAHDIAMVKGEHRPLKPTKIKFLQCAAFGWEFHLFICVLIILKQIILPFM